MKKLFLSLSVFLFMFAFVSLASATTLTVGNDDTLRSNIDTYTNFTIIDTNHPAVADGTLTIFNYYASNTQPFRFVLVDGDIVKWVSAEITPNDIGPQTWSPASPITIKSNWNLGLYFTQTGTIPFTYGGNPAWYEANNAGLPVVGESLDYAGSSGRVYSFIATGDVFVRSAAITSPLAGATVFGNVSFDATLTDIDGDDNVQWAVRKGTCAAEMGTVLGNVDSHSDPYEWNHITFHASADTSTWDNGEYCFVFNPTESVGDTPIRETREFIVNNITPPSNKDQCKNDGWETFNNPTFKNQGQCVSYVESNFHAGKRN